MKNLFKSNHLILLLLALLTAMLIIPRTAHAAVEAPAVDWRKCFGGTGVDSAKSIQPTSDGGYVIAGTTDSNNNGDVSGNHGEKDAWIVKTNSSGVIEWAKCYGGSSIEYANSIIQTSDGGFVFVGSTGSSDFDVIGIHSDLYADAWIVKLNSNGEIEWRNCFGGTHNDTYEQVIQTEDNGYIAVGNTLSSDGDITGKHGSKDIIAVKYSSSGAVQWKKCLGGNYDDTAFSVHQTNDNGCILAGDTNSTADGDVTGLHGTSYDAWVVKLDADGNIAWKKCYGGSSHERAYRIWQTSDSGYIMAGQTKSNDEDVSGNHNPSTYDAWVVKMNSAGSIEWQKCYGGTSDDYFISVQELTNSYLIAGSTLSSDGDLVGQESIGAWLMRISASGTIIWQKCYGGAFQQAASLNNTYVAAGGNMAASEPDFHGNWDAWVVKLNPEIPKSTNANLSSLTINGMTVPGFDKNTLVYDIGDVVCSKTTLDIAALPEDSHTTVTGETGTQTFAYGVNEYTIKVTAEDDETEKTYTIRASKTSTSKSKAIYVIPGIMGSELFTSAGQQLWLSPGINPAWTGDEAEKMKCLPDGTSKYDVVGKDLNLDDDNYGTYLPFEPADNTYDLLLSRLINAKPDYQAIFFPL